MGRRYQARWHGDGRLQRLRQPMGWQAAGAGRFVPAQHVRVIRHGRECASVDRGLLPRQLQRSAGGWFGLDAKRQLFRPYRARRLLVRLSQRTAIFEPKHVCDYSADQLPRLPGRSHACTVSLACCARRVLPTALIVLRGSRGPADGLCRANIHIVKSAHGNLRRALGDMGNRPTRSRCQQIISRVARDGVAKPAARLI